MATSFNKNHTKPSISASLPNHTGKPTTIPMFLKGVFFSDMVWYHELATATFKSISTQDIHTSDFAFSSLALFFERIKPCFLLYINNLYTSFLHFFSTEQAKTYSTKIYLKFLVPFRLNRTDYTWCFLQITPEFYNDKLIGCYFVLVPLKHYDFEPLCFYSVLDGVESKKMAHKFSLFHLPKINFTKKQELLFYYLLNNSPVAEIQQRMKLTEVSLKHLLGRILVKLNCFFDHLFADVYEAIAYYARCFLLADYQL